MWSLVTRAVSKVLASSLPTGIHPLGGSAAAGPPAGGVLFTYLGALQTLHLQGVCLFFKVTQVGSSSHGMSEERGAENILILFLLSPNHRNSSFEPECSMQLLPREQGCFRHPVGFCLWAFTRPVAERRNVPQPCRQREMLPSEDRQTSGFPVVFLTPFHRNGRRLARSSVTGHGAVVCSGVIGPQPGVHAGRNGHPRAPPSLPSRPRTRLYANAPLAFGSGTGAPNGSGWCVPGQ